MLMGWQRQEGGGLEVLGHAAGGRAGWGGEQVGEAGELKPGGGNLQQGSSK